MKKYFVLAVLSLAVISQPVTAREKFDRGVTKSTFVPKGQWFFGGNLSYTQHTNDDFKFLVLDDFTSRGYTLSVKPFVGYTFANNLGAGVSFAYDRTMLQIDNVDLNLGEDLQFSIDDYYNKQHVYTGTVFLRNFINLGNSRRFGLHNDFKIQFGGGEGKVLNGKGETLEGTYQKIYKVGVVFSPGMTVFINDFAAVEVSVGILGFQYKRIEQTTNQVYTGSRQTSGANFKIDIFSIALGIAFYL